MTRERDPLLDEIGATLSVEPSPAFAARVRAEVASGRMGWPWRAHLVAVPVVLALTMAGAVWLDRQASPQLPASVRVRVAGESAPPATATAPAAEEARPLRMAARRMAAARVNPPGAPEVLVPSDQAEGLRLWIAYVRERSPMLPPGQRLGDGNRDAGELPPLPEITRIEVPALTIEPLPGAESRNAGDLDD
jgi:hypothetical protein